MMRATLLLSTLAPLLLARPANAELTGNVGGFVGVSFGDGVKAEWGVAASLGHAWTKEPTDTPYRGVGGYVVFSASKLVDARLSVGGLAATWLGKTELEGVAEFGPCFRFSDARLGLHTGVLLNVSYATFYARQDHLLGRYGFGVGAQSGPFLGHERPTESVAVPGRPYRDAAGSAWSALTEPGDLPADAAVWHRMAHDELASVPAFLQLARELLFAGAPTVLVERSLAAARDEVHHAHLCATMASRLAGTALSPSAPSAGFRAPLRGAAALQRLAAESVLDGWLGEGENAHAAAAALGMVRDPFLIRANRAIARDEARHAALGRDIVSWAVQRGGESVRRAVSRAFEFGMDAAPREPRLERAPGLLEPEQRVALAQHHRESAAREIRAVC